MTNGSQQLSPQGEARHIPPLPRTAGETKTRESHAFPSMLRLSSSA